MYSAPNKVTHGGADKDEGVLLKEFINIYLRIDISAVEWYISDDR